MSVFIFYVCFFLFDKHCSLPLSTHCFLSTRPVLPIKPVLCHYRPHTGTYTTLLCKVSVHIESGEAKHLHLLYVGLIVFKYLFPLFSWWIWNTHCLWLKRKTVTVKRAVMTTRLCRFTKDINIAQLHVMQTQIKRSADMSHPRSLFDTSWHHVSVCECIYQAWKLLCDFLIFSYWPETEKMWLTTYCTSSIF